jgi:Anti-sigma-K factor rskA
MMRKGGLMNDDESIAYLAGEPVAPREPAERAELDRLRGALADPAVWVEPSPDLQERIVGAIAGAGATSSDSRADQGSGTSAGDRNNVVKLRPRWTRYAILSAAAVLLVVGLTVAVTNQSNNKPAEFAASLEGTDRAPEASGEVTLTKTESGWQIDLQAKGLPRLDNGAYYQAWLKNEEGILVTIGTFNEPDDVTLWAGVAPSGFPTLTVTRQRANGDPTSSGQVVLTGISHPAD